MSCEYHDRRNPRGSIARRRDTSHGPWWEVIYRHPADYSCYAGKSYRGDEIALWVRLVPQTDPEREEGASR